MIQIMVKDNPCLKRLITCGKFFCEVTFLDWNIIPFQTVVVCEIAFLFMASQFFYHELGAIDKVVLLCVR